MRTAKRAIIGMIAVIATLAVLFFVVVGVIALATNTPYVTILQAIWTALPFGK